MVNCFVYLWIYLIIHLIDQLVFRHWSIIRFSGIGQSVIIYPKLFLVVICMTLYYLTLFRLILPILNPSWIVFRFEKLLRVDFNSTLIYFTFLGYTKNLSFRISGVWLTKLMRFGTSRRNLSLNSSLVWMISYSLYLQFMRHKFCCTFGSDIDIWILSLLFTTKPIKSCVIFDGYIRNHMNISLRYSLLCKFILVQGRCILISKHFYFI